MRRNSQLRLVSLFLGVLLMVSAWAVNGSPKALPETVAHAHSVFLENETGFNELQYELIMELSKWGRFDVADSREKADLILRLDNGNHVRVVPEGQFPGAATNAVSDTAEIPKGHTRIALLDPKTDTLLWSDSHKTEGGKVKSGHLLDGLRDAFDTYEKSRR